MPSFQITAPAAEPIDLVEAKAHLRVTDNVQDDRIAVAITAAREAAETITRRQLVTAQWKFVLDKFPSWLSAGAIGEWFSSNWGYAPQVLRTLPGDATGYEIYVPHAPIQQVQSIIYTDTSGNPITMVGTDYIIDDTSEPLRVTPAFGTYWPSSRLQTNAVQVQYYSGYATPFDVDPVANTITPGVPARTYAAGDIVRFSNSGGVLPTPLRLNLNYYVINPTATTFQVSKTLAGAAVVLLDTGDGQSFIGAIPGAIKSWMLIRIGSLYENREEVAIINRGQVHELPFVDGLLDPWRSLLV